MFPGLSRGAGRHGTDKEVEVGGGTIVVSLVVTMEGAVATAGSEVLCVGEDDVTVVVAIGVPTGLPFCLTLGLSLPSAFKVSLSKSLLTSRNVHSLDTGSW